MRRDVTRAAISLAFVITTMPACAPRMHVGEAPNSSRARIQVAPDVTIPSGTIAGVVRDEDSGAPLGSVRVSITPNNMTHPIQILTDDQGRFRIDDLPLGPIVLEARLIGYGTSTDTIELQSGVDVIVGLHVRAMRLGPVTVLPSSPAGGDAIAYLTSPPAIRARSTARQFATTTISLEWSASRNTKCAPSGNAS
jgi:Carboxypeptidase regulatory-like domain